MRIMGWIVGWKFRLSAAKSFEMWWPGTELNRHRLLKSWKLLITNAAKDAEGAGIQIRQGKSKTRLARAEDVATSQIG